MRSVFGFIMLYTVVEESYEREFSAGAITAGACGKDYSKSWNGIY